MPQVSASQLEQFGKILSGSTRFSPTLSNAPTALPQNGQLLDAGLFAFNRFLANDKIRGKLFDEVRAANTAQEGGGIPIVMGPSNRVTGRWLWVSHVYPIPSIPTLSETIEALIGGNLGDLDFQSYGFLGVISFGTNILPGKSLEVTALWANGEKIWVPDLSEVIVVTGTDITAINTTLGTLNVLRLEAPLGGTDLEQFIPHQFQGVTITGFTSGGNNLTNVRLLREGTLSGGGTFMELEDSSNTAVNEGAGDTIVITQNNLVLSPLLGGLAFTPTLGPVQHDPATTTMIDGALNGIVQGTLPALLAPIVNIQLDPLLVEYGHPAYVGQVWMWFQMDLRKFNNQIPTIQAEVRENSGEANNVRALSGAIADILIYGGLDECEFVTGSKEEDELIAPPVVGNLRGMAVETPRSPKDMLAPIFEAHDLVDYEDWGKLVVINRGQEKRVNIDLARIGAHEPGSDAARPFMVTDVDDQELMASVVVRYIDSNKLLVPDAQPARRHNVNTSLAAEVQLPLTLTADEAKSCAHRILWNAWRNRRRITLNLPPSYLYLHEQMMLLFTVGDRIFRFIVQEINEGANFLLEVTGFIEDENAAQDNLIGVAGPTQQSDPYVPPYMVLQVFDFAPLSNGHVNVPGVYQSRAAVDPAAQFQGATVWASFGPDTVENFGTVPLDSSITESVIGYAVGVLPVAPVHCSMLFDRKSTLQVKMWNGALFSTTEQHLLDAWANTLGLITANPNILRIGDELVGFVNVVDDGVQADGLHAYTISRLLRGLRNTDSSITHVAGEPVAKLSSNSTSFATVDSGVYFPPAGTWYFRCVPTGGSLAQAVPSTTLAPTLGLKKPMTVTGLHAKRGTCTPDNSDVNDLTIYFAPRMKRPMFRVFTDWYDEEDDGAFKREFYVIIARKASDNSILRYLGSGNIFEVAGPATGWRKASYSAADQATDGLTTGAAVKFDVQKWFGSFLGNVKSVTI